MNSPSSAGSPSGTGAACPFVLMHAGAVVLPFFTTFSWKLVALAIGLYLVRMFAITGFYHRYFSHRSYKTSRPFQFVLALAGLTCVQKGPLWWAAHHRHHHKHSDQPGDVHSPGLQSFSGPMWAGSWATTGTRPTSRASPTSSSTRSSGGWTPTTWCPA